MNQPAPNDQPDTNPNEDPPRHGTTVTYLGRVAGKNRTLLMQEREASAVVRKTIRETVEHVLPRAIEQAGVGTPSILTLARLADLLGVKPRTVTETFIRQGLPYVRLSKGRAPVFVHDDVIAWLRERGAVERPGE